MTEKGEDFLLGDISEGCVRILIFSTNRKLELLAECEHWFADGTFNTTPSLFEQVYAVHDFKRCEEGYDEILPAVYALLPDKRNITYERMLTRLKHLESRLSPKTCLLYTSRCV